MLWDRLTGCLTILTGITSTHTINWIMILENVCYSYNMEKCKNSSCLPMTTFYRKYYFKIKMEKILSKLQNCLTRQSLWFKNYRFIAIFCLLYNHIDKNQSHYERQMGAYIYIYIFFHTFTSQTKIHKRLHTQIMTTKNMQRPTKGDVSY